MRGDRSTREGVLRRCAGAVVVAAGAVSRSGSRGGGYASREGMWATGPHRVRQCRTRTGLRREARKARPADRAELDRWSGWRSEGQRLGVVGRWDLWNRKGMVAMGDGRWMARGMGIGPGGRVGVRHITPASPHFDALPEVL